MNSSGNKYTICNVTCLALFLLLLIGTTNPCYAISLSCGEVHSDSLTPAEQDAYTFSAQAGDVVKIIMTRTSDTIMPYISLYDPDGVELKSTGGITSAEIISDPLPSSGTYTFIAAESYYDDAGDYNISWRRINNNPCYAISLSCGEVHSDSLTPAEQDAYTFSAQAGDVVKIIMTRTSDTIMPYISLYDPDGVELKSTGGITSAEIISDPLPSSGTYTFIAAESYYDDAGDYNISWLFLNRICPIEICDDSIDNDSDGLIDCDDPDCQETYYRDADGDGYGDPDNTTEDCTLPSGYVEDNTDCDDGDSTIYSGAPELCDDKDNDCDDLVDEDFPTLGQACDVGVGECFASGTLICSSDGLSTVCDATPGEPSSELCDGLDNDCDGQVDEECADGDVNEDGNITPQDALMVFQHYLGMIQLDATQQTQADVNNDGSITPADALCIFQKYLGLESCLD